MSMKTKQLGRTWKDCSCLNCSCALSVFFLHEKARLFGELSEQNRMDVHDHQFELEKIDW